MNQQRYSLLSRILHWLMAIMIFGLIAVGNYMSGLADDAPERSTLIVLHKASGFIFLWLVLVRLGWALARTAPALPQAFSHLERRLITTTKHLMYLAMLAVPLSGWAMSNFAGYAINLGALKVPLLFEKNRAFADFFHEVHEYAPWVLLGLIVVHLTAVIYHKLEGGDKDILHRML